MAAERETPAAAPHSLAEAGDAPEQLPPFLIYPQLAERPPSLLESLLSQISPAKTALFQDGAPIPEPDAQLFDTPPLEAAGGPAGTGSGGSRYDDSFGSVIEGLEANDGSAEDFDSISFAFDGPSFGQPLAPLADLDSGVLFIDNDLEEVDDLLHDDEDPDDGGSDENPSPQDMSEQNQDDEDEDEPEPEPEPEPEAVAADDNDSGPGDPLTLDVSGQQLWGALKVSALSWDGAPAAVAAYGNGDGLGVAGGRIGQQIDHSAEGDGKSEALIVEFPEAVMQASVGINRLYAADNGNAATKEMGHWAAYDGDRLIAEGDFGAASGASLTLDIAPGIAFSKLIFTAIDYNADSGLDGSDSSDYSVQSIAWTPAGDAPSLVEGTNGANELVGGAGVDWLYGKNGGDNLFAGGGSDLLFGGKGRDELFGEGGDDELNGENGGDSLFGGAGNDLLFGGKGNDDLFGDAGADLLDGGAGADRLTGGDGADVFLFDFEGDQGISGRDRILDFDPGEGDSLRFANLLDGDGDGADLDDLVAAISNVRTVGGGDDLRIDFEDGGGVILEDAVQLGLDSLSALLDPTNGVTLEVV